MQKRFLMHSQLVAEARTDAKTGLLNAAAWHRESATELSRAKGYWSPASAAIIDIDHFKRSTTPTATWPATASCGSSPTGSRPSFVRVT